MEAAHPHILGLQGAAKNVMCCYQCRISGRQKTAISQEGIVTESGSAVRKDRARIANQSVVRETLGKRRETMKTRIVMMVGLVLFFAACSRQGEQDVPEGAEKPVLEQKALESKEVEPVEQAAKTGEEDQEVKSCLQLVSEAKYADALPVCLSALKKHPANEEVKAAAEKAQDAVGDATGAVTDTMQGVQGAAGEGG